MPAERTFDEKTFEDLVQHVHNPKALGQLTEKLQKMAIEDSLLGSNTTRNQIKMDAQINNLRKLDKQAGDILERHFAHLGVSNDINILAALTLKREYFKSQLTILKRSPHLADFPLPYKKKAVEYDFLFFAGHTVPDAKLNLASMFIVIFHMEGSFDITRPKLRDLALGGIDEGIFTQSLILGQGLLEWMDRPFHEMQHTFEGYIKKLAEEVGSCELESQAELKNSLQYCLSCFKTVVMTVVTIPGYFDSSIEDMKIMNPLVFTTDADGIISAKERKRIAGTFGYSIYSKMEASPIYKDHLSLYLSKWMDEKEIGPKLKTLQQRIENAPDGAQQDAAITEALDSMQNFKKRLRPGGTQNLDAAVRAKLAEFCLPGTRQVKPRVAAGHSQDHEAESLEEATNRPKEQVAKISGWANKFTEITGDDDNDMKILAKKVDTEHLHLDLEEKNNYVMQSICEFNSEPKIPHLSQLQAHVIDLLEVQSKFDKDNTDPEAPVGVVAGMVTTIHTLHEDILAKESKFQTPGGELLIDTTSKFMKLLDKSKDNPEVEQEHRTHDLIRAGVDFQDHHQKMMDNLKAANVDGAISEYVKLPNSDGFLTTARQRIAKVLEKRGKVIDTTAKASFDDKYMPMIQEAQSIQEYACLALMEPYLAVLRRLCPILNQWCKGADNDSWKKDLKADADLKTVEQKAEETILGIDEELLDRPFNEALKDGWDGDNQTCGPADGRTDWRVTL